MASSGDSQALTRSKAKKTLLDVEYFERPEFGSGILPTNADILENMLYILRPSRAGKQFTSKENACHMLAELLQEHWLFCNIYTITTWAISKKIGKLYNDFQVLIQTRKARQSGTFVNNAKQFNSERDALFDIFCQDPRTRKELENQHGVKMTQEEWDFLSDQRGPRQMLCQGFVDRKWERTAQRRRHTLEVLESNRKAAESQGTSQSEAGNTMSTDTETEGELSVEEIFYQESHDSSVEEDECRPRKMRRYESSVSSTKWKESYKHVRKSAKKVRSKYFRCVDKLKCVYHMSHRQAEGAVVEVANILFGRNWKFHEESDTIDVDTLPAASAVRITGKAIEAQALGEIAQEILSATEKVTITYMDDGSKKQGVGSFSVQGIMIDNIYRALPTLPLSSESRQNLADLRVAVFDILQTASGVDAKDLHDRVDFVMTDQTLHNINVEKIVAAEFGSTEIPDHLFCNVHPALMFNRIITDQWAKIEAIIGKDKIYSSFLVNATSNSTSAATQGLDCMTRLITHDFDSKPWNKANEFDDFISPKKNKSVSLKDERFNRLTLTCAVITYHHQDLVEFLEKYEHVTNQLACIVRCFIELEVLKVLFCVGALVGIHLTEPFLSLTNSSVTTYSTLIPAFQQLYKDLTTTDPTLLLDTKKPAFAFTSEERFKSTRYDEDICMEIEKTAEQYRPHILKVLKILLPALAEGFQKQKGNLFGFGDYDQSADSRLSTMNQQKLEKAPINNITSEGEVGLVNYELTIRGRKQLESVSSNIVKAKAYDLLEKSPSSGYKAYIPLIKKDGPLPELKLEWTERQQQLREQGMTTKEVANMAVDRRRMKDLDALKKMGGPFTSSVGVEKYMKSRAKRKEERMYLEVRYARDTSLTVPKSSDIFRLMRSHKKLPVKTYATNLKIYLDNVTAKSEVTLHDLEGALDTVLEK